MKRSTLLAAAAAFALLMPSIAPAQERKDERAGKPLDRSEIYQQLNLFGDVLERIRRDYVDEANERDLIENAINGMLQSLDPHSAYMNPKMFRDMQVQTRGEFGGLGIEVTMENGVVKVIAPIDDTPAAKAGIQAGDLIVAIDNEPVQGLSLQDAVEKMRGKVDTTIKLGIRRANRDPFDVTLTRAIIKIRSVRARLEGDIGYLRITSFTEQSDAGAKAAVEGFQKELGGKLKGLVIDLRNNPGGLLDQAIKISDLFLERGEIVSTKARKPEDVNRWNAQAGDVAGGLPIVVLINGGSASASEIVAGALQDHRRALIMGTRSFGKGSVQTIMPVTGGGALRLTTSLYFTPSGRSIQKEGIKPDIEVEQAKIENLAGGRSVREENLRRSITNPNMPAQPVPTQPPATPPGSRAPGTPPQPGAQTPPGGAQPPAAESDPAEPPNAAQTDYQLQRALDLIRAVALYSQRNN
jgi:carboxyl-terminal processing protease